jgi:hypothetical protein
MWDGSVPFPHLPKTVEVSLPIIRKFTPLWASITIEASVHTAEQNDNGPETRLKRQAIRMRTSGKAATWKQVEAGLVVRIRGNRKKQAQIVGQIVQRPSNSGVKGPKKPLR